MNRRHRAADDFEFIIHHFGNGRQTIRGAGCVGDDVVLCWIVYLMIHAQHERHILILRRCRDNDFLHRSAQVLFGVIRVGKAPGRLDHNLCSHRLPRQLRRIFFCKHANRPIFNLDAITARGNLVFQIPQNRIVFQQVSQRFGIG